MQNLRVRIPQSSCYKALYKKSNEQLLLESALYLTFYPKRFRKITQLAHDVVTTLGFGCILAVTSDNVVTTLCFRRRYYPKNSRCYKVLFSTLVFRPRINVATTSWFWCRFPDENLNVLQYRYNFFSKDMYYCLAIPFFEKQYYSVCINAKRSLKWWIFENLQLVTWTEKRLILCILLIRNSSLFSGGKFGRGVV